MRKQLLKKRGMPFSVEVVGVNRVFATLSFGDTQWLGIPFQVRGMAAADLSCGQRLHPGHVQLVGGFHHHLVLDSAAKAKVGSDQSLVGDELREFQCLAQGSSQEGL